MRERDAHEAAYQRLAGARVTGARNGSEPAPAAMRAAAAPAVRSTLLLRLALLRPRTAATTGNE